MNKQTEALKMKKHHANELGKLASSIFNEACAIRGTSFQQALASVYLSGLHHGKQSLRTKNEQTN